MKQIILIISLCILLFLLVSCTYKNQSSNLNVQDSQSLNSKINNINNNFSYEEYISLIIEYAKVSKFPSLNK